MKRTIIAVIAATVVAGTVYAAGIKCWQCKGTGWWHNAKCLVCGGDGEI